MQHLNALSELKALIERDLKVATDPDDNAAHLKALNAVDYLLENYL